LQGSFYGVALLRKEFHADIVVVNGENAANGFGLSAEIMRQFFERGADVITTGNHIWQQDDILPFWIPSRDCSDLRIIPRRCPDMDLSSSSRVAEKSRC
jgi:calcineurin-like phosphoesterase